MRRRQVASALAAAITLLGLALRATTWGHNRFVEDEALYAYWGLRLATGDDPLLEGEVVDKPPLFPYLVGLSLRFLSRLPLAADAGALRAQEMAAALPSLLASTVAIALTYRLGSVFFFGTGAGLLAALLVALSPFDISFAATAFTDPLMTALVLAATLAAAKKRLGPAGALAGLAAATKQQGLLFLPLIAAVGLYKNNSLARQGSRQAIVNRWLAFALGFGAVAAAVVGWDMSRDQRPGFFAQSLISYGGLSVAAPGSLSQRALSWLQLVGRFWVSPWLNGLLAAVLFLSLVGVRIGQGRSQPKAYGLILVLFALCFLVLHVFISFQIWDRYLLGLVPLVALAAAGAFAALGRAWPRRWSSLYICGLVALLVGSLARPVACAAHGELPIGGDHGAYDGIDTLALYIRDHLPSGAVLYHHWLGHHYRFYLYGAPLRMHWYPDVQDLVHDALVYRREPRYIAFPSWRDSTPMRLALTGAGIDLAPVLETTRRDGTVSFRLYQLEGP